MLCVCTSVQAQSNFVLNPDFERYDTCPFSGGQVTFCKFWQNAISNTYSLGIEYFNSCAMGNPYTNCPINGAFYQPPRTKNGRVGGGMYYDKTPPPPPYPIPFNNRDYLQNILIKSLEIGKTYCVSFWVNLTEASGYATNKIGAYLDDGSINSAVDSAGKEITSVIPQIYTDSIIKDTMYWTKIEGSFVANGTETYITIGNFFTNAATTTVVTNYWFTYPQYSYYLIDDVSVIPIDLKADAGSDKWAEQTKKVEIGRVGDSTAIGLDCKWYKKGALIDSGAIISVNANAIKGAIDTYIVVQNVCGNITRDTVVVSTVGLGMQQFEAEKSFTIYPNPSSGNVSISCFVIPKESITAKVYDLLGRIVQQELLNFSNKEAVLKLNIPTGSYILEVKDEDGNVQRERIGIE